jgi:F-type H+-transporting ATPase subunit delta
MSATADKPAKITADAGAQRVARVYAEALYEEAEKAGAVEEVRSELDGLLKDIVGTDPSLRSLFLGGLMGREVRGETIRKAFEGRASDLLFRFLMVLNEHDRLELLRPVRAVFDELIEKRAGKVRVFVTTAIPLLDRQRERLVSQLREVTGKEPVIEAKVDADILGGLVVQVGDWRYDASVRYQLEIIRNQLIESSSHEIQAGRDRFSTADGDR